MGLGDTGFDFYDIERQTFFLYRCSKTKPLSYTSPYAKFLPSSSAIDHAKGLRSEPPTCSMKLQFMDQPYVWPGTFEFLANLCKNSSQDCSHLYPILSSSTVLPPFSTVAKTTIRCNRVEKDLQVYHVTVVCLEDSKENFGKLYDYCPCFHGTECAATLSVEQGDRVVLEEVLRVARAMEPRPKLGGWVYLGEVWAEAKDTGIPRALVSAKREKVVVETFIFFREAHPPMSLPLVYHVREKSNELELWLSQPLFTQVFASLSPHKGLSVGTETVFKIDAYSPRYKSYIPASTKPLRTPITIPLPLASVPVFKLRDIVIAGLAPDYALGCHKELLPMCGVKATFMDSNFLWPSVYNDRPREYKQSAWTVLNLDLVSCVSWHLTAGRLLVLADSKTLGELARRSVNSRPMPIFRMDSRGPGDLAVGTAHASSGPWQWLFVAGTVQRHPPSTGESRLVLTRLRVQQGPPDALRGPPGLPHKPGPSQYHISQSTSPPSPHSMCPHSSIANGRPSYDGRSPVSPGETPISARRSPLPPYAQEPPMAEREPGWDRCMPRTQHVEWEHEQRRGRPGSEYLLHKQQMYSGAHSPPMSQLAPSPRGPPRSPPMSPVRSPRPYWDSHPDMPSGPAIMGGVPGQSPPSMMHGDEPVRSYEGPRFDAR
ncbi:uncharacterized protein B0H18DRAFT_959904 [Fomitopsis serialis]|uniref:uncharacterized protein n=1 Tax=Fomitopsis serialis TaxID=139415 RepID=UPI0020083380|nr:uncharacterized protein B0H18DRAFT_959904 [Neoantrodia serialis]KAH9914316.1 hypothetical protein B0H18DRAFT_959904 [Neoantrodia serialis]